MSLVDDAVAGTARCDQALEELVVLTGVTLLITRCGRSPDAQPSVRTLPSTGGPVAPLACPAGCARWTE